MIVRETKTGSAGEELSMAITLYGIKNCDTMKKARAWLDARGVVYAFHDYNTAGIARDRLEAWAADVGWETLLNRAGTTFRKLSATDRDGLDARKAIVLMVAQPAMIKRPVLELEGTLLVGFKPERYGEAFGARR
jgi:arsenate reductase (glutaredoxin)